MSNIRVQTFREHCSVSESMIAELDTKVNKFLERVSVVSVSTTYNSVYDDHNKHINHYGFCTVVFNKE